VLLSAGSYDYRFPPSWRIARFRAAWSLLGLVGGPGAIQRSLRLARVSTGASQPSPDPLDTREGWAALGRAFRQSVNEASFVEMEEIVEHRLGHPALVVWGSENRILPAASARVIFRGRKNVKFIEIAGAAHAVHEEEPAIVADLIRDFLE
jgi:pimeloyl-ACP methyl ester carboxylesterase